MNYRQLYKLRNDSNFSTSRVAVLRRINPRKNKRLVPQESSIKIPIEKPNKQEIKSVSFIDCDLRRDRSDHSQRDTFLRSFHSVHSRSNQRARPPRQLQFSSAPERALSVECLRVLKIRSYLDKTSLRLAACLCSLHTHTHTHSHTRVHIHLLKFTLH